MSNPLTPSAIREAILNRMDAIGDSCNSRHIAHVEGVVSGLLWALNGVYPKQLPKSTAELLAMAGIPYRMDGDYVVYSTPGDTDWPEDAG